MRNQLVGDIAEVSETFNDGKFWSSGLMTNRYYYTIETNPIVRAIRLQWGKS